GGGGGGGGGTLAGTVTLMLVGWFCCEVVLPVLSTLVSRPSGFSARPTVVGGVPGFPAAPVVSRLLVGPVGAEGRTSRVPVVLTAVVLADNDSVPVAEVSTVEMPLSAPTTVLALSAMNLPEASNRDTPPTDLPPV